jgi:hypothetical protein
MERADFVFQIFFETLELRAKLSHDFGLFIRLFQLPVIEIDRLSGPPGVFELSTGKKLSLKMPFIEVLDSCPLWVMIRTPRPGHTTERRAEHLVPLQNIFSHAIQRPGRFVQQHFNEVVRDRSNEPCANIAFSVSVCYTSSTQEALTNLKPIILHGESSSDSDVSLKPAAKVRKDTATMTRVPLAPDPPVTRDRSIFYFDRNDLMEENKLLEAEIKRLTGRVGELKDIVGHHQNDPAKQNPKAKTGPRSEFIYRPPGLALQRPRA